MAALVTAGGLAVENLQTRSLRCRDGLLTPYRGRALPWTSRELNDPSLPPLAVSTSLCHEVRFSSHQELERHYLHLARARGESIPAVPERGASAPPKGPSERPAPAAETVDEDRRETAELGRAFALTREAARVPSEEREL